MKKTQTNKTKQKHNKTRKPEKTEKQWVKARNLKVIHIYRRKSLCLQGDSSNAYPGKCFVQLIFAAGKNLFIASSTSRADRYLTLDQPKFSIEPFEHH